MCEVYVAQNPSDNPAKLLLNNLVEDFMFHIHHVIKHVGFNEALHGGQDGLLTDKTLHDLHDLLLYALFPEVLPSLLVLGFGG